MKCDVLIEPDVLIFDSENPAVIVDIEDNERLKFDTALSSDRRIRKAIRDKLLEAQEFLPPNLGFIIYEAYRSSQKQIHMWEMVRAEIAKTYPEDDDQTLDLRCNRFIANPYTHGSGHQYGCAVDIALMDISSRLQIDMGGGVQEFDEKTETNSPCLTELQKQHRAILKESLEKVGLVNYPPEWWHYSYGDRQWAIQTGEQKTLYAKLPF